MTTVHLASPGVRGAAPATLLSPAALGRLHVRNRVVMAPVDSVFRTEDGGSNPQHLRYLEARARGGVGLILMDNTIVRWPEGSVGSKSLRLDQDRFIASIGDAVEAVHAYGALIGAQLNHAGRQTTLGGSQGIPLVSSSAVAWPDSGTVPRELSSREIRDLRSAFVDAARRAAKAGFDAVEIHAAHGYLLSSFLSPALNRRSDEYGGSTRARTRLVTEIIADVQDALPQLPILVRMNCVDGVPNGIDEEESIEIARLLAGTGIDGLDVSAGTYEASMLTFPPMMLGEGPLMRRIKRIKDAVDVPVIGVGRIVRPETAEAYLADGSVDFVALGRALIADPDWVLKAAAGQPQRIRHCIGCNHGCIHRIDQDLSMKCNVNPDLGREDTRRHSAVRSRRRILVAGAGPAGIEFSVRSARAGHEVHLFEREPIVGGQLVHARIPSFKSDLGTYRDYLEGTLADSGVIVHLSTALTETAVDEYEPDLVVVATGADPVPADRIVDPSGLSTCTFEDVLRGNRRLDGPVTVIGGGPNGCETAVFLALQGFQVTVLEMADALVADEDHSVLQWVTESFERHGIKHRLRSRVIGAVQGAVVVLGPDGTTEEIETGTLVSAAGMRPRAGLVDELRARTDVPLEVIGDAFGVGTILEATGRAAWLADRMATEQAALQHHP